MKKYAPNTMELAARDVTSRAEATEIAEGRGIDGNVLLDLRHLGPDDITVSTPSKAWRQVVSWQTSRYYGTISGSLPS